MTHTVKSCKNRSPAAQKPVVGENMDRVEVGELITGYEENEEIHRKVFAEKLPETRNYEQSDSSSLQSLEEGLDYICYDSIKVEVCESEETELLFPIIDTGQLPEARQSDDSNNFNSESDCMSGTKVVVSGLDNDKELNVIATHEEAVKYELSRDGEYTEPDFIGQDIQQIPALAKGRSRQKLYKCDYCMEFFSRRIDITAHISTHMKVSQREDITEEFSPGCSNRDKLPVTAKTHVCLFCNKLFSTMAHLKSHLLTHTGMKTHTCQKCKKKFARKSDLNRHWWTHTTFKPHMCIYCNKCFAQSANLKSHLRTHSGVKPYTCNHCSSSFAIETQLKTHLLTHSDIKPFICEQCGKSFAARSYLKSHWATHTDLRPYVCGTCNKSFSWKSDLNRHSFVHSEFKQFQCEYCNSSFSQKSNLKAHIEETHTRIRPYHCQHCDKSFSLRSRLKSHLLTHSTLKTYVCELHNKAYALKSHFKTHWLLAHTDIRPHSCDQCEKSFARKCDLNKHLLIHSKVKPFTCQSCNHSFTQKGTLLRHLHTHNVRGK